MEIEVEDNGTEPFDSNEMTQILSGRLYTSLAEFHNKIEELYTTEQATDIIITALGVNLGHIIGQLPPRSRKTAMRDIRRIIQDQTLEVAKMTDLQKHGQVGHA
jgi:hypothetical protein